MVKLKNIHQISRKKSHATHWLTPAPPCHIGKIVQCSLKGPNLVVNKIYQVEKHTCEQTSVSIERVLKEFSVQNIVSQNTI